MDGNERKHESTNRRRRFANKIVELRDANNATNESIGAAAGYSGSKAKDWGGNLCKGISVSMTDAQALDLDQHFEVASGTVWAMYLEATCPPEVLEFINRRLLRELRATGLTESEATLIAQLRCAGEEVLGEDGTPASDRMAQAMFKWLGAMKSTNCGKATDFFGLPPSTPERAMGRLLRNILLMPPQSCRDLTLAFSLASEAIVNAAVGAKSSAR